jgi:hypothetical protein
VKHERPSLGAAGRTGVEVAETGLKREGRRRCWRSSLGAISEEFRLRLMKHPNWIVKLGALGPGILGAVSRLAYDLLRN